MANNQNNQNKYVGLDALKAFLDNIKTKFSELGHKHTISDLTDYTVDSELTSSSTNPVANKAVNDGINLLYETMFSITDEKADINHTHTKEDIGLENVDNTADDEKYVYHAEIAEAANSVEWKNISNKPFSTAVNGTVILPVTNVEESDDGHGIGRGSTGRFSAAVVSGEEYKVVFDGAEYYCTAYTDPIMNDYIILGNFDVIEPITGDANRDTGEPFLICYSIIYKYAGVYTPVIDSHTVEITHIEGVVESIDESCIPESIARIEDVPSIDGLATETFATNAASEKLAEAKEYADTVASGKSDTSHNHDNLYDALGSAADSLAESKSYTDTKVANLASASTVDTKISTHNTSTSAHNDIRDLITGLTTRLNTLANSDDTTLDQMSEVVAYIKNNKSLIDGITTSKVNVSDIVDNLTTNTTNKPLSAAQGVAIKNLIDALQTELDSHTHSISDVSGLQSALDGKAASSHGTHVTYSTTAPVMDGTASVGTATTVARSDHKHPTDTSRASKDEFDAHTADTTKHITADERNSWNAKDSVSFEQITTSGNTIGTITINDVDTTLYAPMVSVNVGESSTSTNSTVADPYIKIRDTNGFRGQVRIQGDGATTVESNSSGTITIFSTDTDTKVKQMETAANGNFPLLLAPTDVASTDYRYSYYADGIYANPSLSKIYADISGTAGLAKGLTDDSDEKIQLNYGGTAIVATSGTGDAYTATVDGMTELKTGARITIIPHTNSTNTTATLNVNNLGAKQIRQRLSTSTTTTVAGHISNWIISGKPLTLTYNGTYWVTDYARPDANTIYGTTKVANGGTGKTTVTSGNFLVGNGTSAMLEKTPAEVLSLINGASVATMTTAEYEALEAEGTINANTLYMLTDAEEEEEVLITTDDIDTICGATV